MKRASLFRLSPLLALALLLGALPLFHTAPASAAEFTANSYDTLVSAINSANANADTDVINITGDITLTADVPAVTKSVTINGGGRTIDGDNLSRAFNFTVGGITVVINDLTLTQNRSGLSDGSGVTDPHGGAIDSTPSSGGRVNLVLNRVTIRDTRSLWQGMSAIQGNGGAVTCGWTNLTINDSVFRNNRGNQGGGLYVGGNCTAEINRSAFFDNTARLQGGAISADTSLSVVKMTNSTVYGNTSGSGNQYDAAIFVSGGATARLWHMTVTDNRAKVASSKGGISSKGTATILHLRNSIVYGNVGGDCDAQVALATNENNIIGSGSNCGAGTNGSSADPMLAASATGSPPYFVLRAGSPAIAAAADCSSLTTEDQRGSRRVGACDIGAYQTAAADLDPTFGIGGKVTTAFNTKASEIYAVAKQSDGKIVAVGWVQTATADKDFALARYNPDGSLDTAFGTGGRVTTDIGGSDDQARTVAIQSDGKIVVAGYAYDSNAMGTDFAAARYNADGSPDLGFGTITGQTRTGKLTTNFGATDVAHAVAIQSDGKIVLAGQAGNSFGVARYHPQGDPDGDKAATQTEPAYTGFDGDGIVTTNFTAGVPDIAHAVAIQSDDKIVLAGYATNDNNTAVTTDDRKDFALARYTTTGALDTGFDTDGKVTTAMTVNNDEVLAMAIQSDGKIVAVGYSHAHTYHEVALARYNTNGSLDSSFDSDGKVVTESIGTFTDQAQAVAIQSDGKIVVAGLSWAGAAHNDFMVARYTSAGALDTAFNTSGSVTTPIGGGDETARGVAIADDGSIIAAGYSNNGSVNEFALAGYTPAGALNGRFGIGGVVTTGFSGSGASSDEARAVAIDSNGKIVVAGHAYNGTDDDTALARYNANGSLDAGFGTNGRVISDLSTSNRDHARAVAIDSNGKIVVAGYAYNGTDDDIAVARYNANGSPDTGFGTNGKTLSGLSGHDWAYAMALLDGGKILVVGDSGGDFILMRFNADGSLDTGFGTGGKALTDFNGGNDRAHAVALQANGKIVVAGYARNNTNTDFALARYNADGSLDTGFGTGGKAPLIHFGFGNDNAYAVAVQPDGKIVVAGAANHGTPNHFALARYNADGTLDTGFGTGGKVSTPVGDTGAGAHAMELQANGKIVVAGYAVRGGAYVFALARYNVNGTLDTDFDAGGTGKAFTGIGASHDRAYAMALQSDGKIVAVGKSYDGAHDDFAVARYLGEEPVSNDATLSGLSVSGSADGTTFDRAARLNPALTPGTTAYTALVPDDVTHVRVTPTASDARATITVNGQAATGGGASGAIPVTPGSTTVSIVVTAEDGETTLTYTISFATVSTDATLSGLSVRASADGTTFDRAASLSPSFSSGALAYTVTVREDVTHVGVTPTTSDAGATVTVNGQATASASASGAVSVSDGSTVSVVVTAGDEVSTRTYTLTVDFEYDATLRGLAVSASEDGATTFAAAELRPDFSPGTTSYRVPVEDDNTHVKVTPTTTIARATVTVNGATVTSGSASAAIAASQGDTVTVAVTGTDGSTTVTYTLELVPPARGIRLYPEGPTTVLEGESARFWVSPPPLESNVSIPVTVTAGTAESGDYQELTSVSTISSRDPFGGTGVIRTYHDADQDDETFTVSLDESMLPDDLVALGVTVDHPSSVTFTIRDDDKPSPVTISVLPDPVRKGSEGQMEEGGAAQIAVFIAERKSQNVSIPITVTSSSGESGDYSAPSSIVIRRGETVGTGTLRALQDDDTNDEILTVSLGSSLPALATAGTPSSAQITIEDDDHASRVFFKRIEPDPVPEGDTAHVVLGIEPAQPERVTIPVTLSHVTSEAGDFGNLSSITFAAGQPEAIGEIRTMQDSDADDDIFQVDMGSLPDGITQSGVGIQVTIDDDEFSSEVFFKRIEPNPVGEGDTAYVVLGIEPKQPERVTIPVTITHVDSEAGDFGSLSSITFAAGQGEGIGELRTRQDSDSDDEVLEIALGSNLPDLITPGTGAARPTSMRVTISDDDSGSGGSDAAPQQQPRPRVERGNASLEVTWFINPGPSYTGFDVEYRAKGTTNWMDAAHSGTAHRHTISGLTNGTTYQVRVRAKINGNAGPWSDPVAEGTPMAPPAAPVGLTVFPGDAVRGTLDVSWGAPSDDVTAYRVEGREAGSQNWRLWRVPETTSFTAYGLKEGTTYNVRVRALIDDITGPWATASGTTRPVP